MGRTYLAELVWTYLAQTNENLLGTMIPAPIYVRVMGNLFNGMIAGEPVLSISTGTRCMSGAGRPIR